MTMKINLLATDARNNNKREEAAAFVACLGGISIGGIIALTFVITERLVGIVI